MGITENAAYLKGLAEGMGVTDNTNEGKIIGKMLDLIEEMADKIAVLEDENNDLYDYMEEMAQDIVDIEDDVYGDEGDGDEDYDDYEDYSDLNDEEDYDGEEDEDLYEVECPTCGEKICFNKDIDLEHFICPACGNPIDDITLDDDSECDESDCANCGGCDRF